MREVSKTVFSLIVALTGTIGAGYAEENQFSSQEYLITERDNIVLSFSEPIYIKNGNIVIYKANDNSIFETIDVSSPQVVGSGTKKITINPLIDFCSSTNYYLTIDSTAFDDAYGNSFSGIKDRASFTFATIDTIAPTIKSFSETIVADRGEIILNFSEPVDVENGKIIIHKRSDDSIVESIDVRSSQVVGTSTSQITITPRSNLAPFTEYYLAIDSLAFDDVAGNSYVGVDDRKSISFETGAFELSSNIDIKDNTPSTFELDEFKFFYYHLNGII